MIIRILGTPAVERDGGGVAAPRGRKSWGLLAFLALSETPPSRHRLASLLFPEAQDPLGALRWTISALRRLLGSQGVIEGDPLRLDLPAGTMLDTDVLVRGRWMEAVRLPGLECDLLEGLSFGSAPAFELWLTGERARLGASSEAVLREAALASLARREIPTATGFATRLVALNPYDENAHVLLARCLGAKGDGQAAERHVEKATELFRRDLGVEPSPAFRAAALSRAPRAAQPTSPASVRAQMEAGQAAVAAGAWQTGLESLRGAAAGVRTVRDEQLRVDVLLSLGSALVHAARGSDEDGAASLHEASSVALNMGQPHLAATARRELAYVELLRGRYERARAWLDEAAELAEDDDVEFAWVAGVRGTCESDVADYPAARSWLEVAVDRAESADAAAPGAFALTFLGRLELLRGDLGAARRALTRSLALARGESWTSFVPLPMSLLAEVTLQVGDIDAAAEAYEHAYALSCQLGDPCWESIGARGLGLIMVAREEQADALERLTEAPMLCRRFPDSYLWIEAYALDALCDVAVETGAPAAQQWIHELETMAARTGMRELLVRAMLHRTRLGERDTLEVAETLMASIDNPALEVVYERAVESVI
jgi:DNA-binding SARP family transcriptional activator/Tfp pilus assembly protein PilF